MKVVSWLEFAAMPPGTIFSYWEPCITSGLHRKEDTLVYARYPSDPVESVDFVETDLIPHVDDPDGKVMPTSDDIDCAGRDGGYDKEQLYLVYEAADIRRFHRMLDNKPAEELL